MSNPVSDIIKDEMESLSKILNSFPLIAEKIDLSKMEKDLVRASEQMYLGSVVDRISIFFDLKESVDVQKKAFDLNQDDFNRTRKEVAKFKAKYMVWARSLIAQMNRTKTNNKLEWLDVKKFAQILASIEIKESKTKIAQQVLRMIEV